MKHSSFYILILSLLLFTSCGGDEVTDPNTENDPNTPDPNDIAYEIQIDANDLRGEVSPLLMGFNVIYSFDKDAMWQGGTGKIPTMLKRFNTGILRYPGGAVVNRYHWSSLNGQGWKDHWSPGYDPGDDQPESEFMDVDEYMTNVTEIGAEPMLGINMGSGMKYNRVQDGIDEAVALVQYCKDKAYDVKYFYLDNEPYHDGANYKMTPQEYADQINLYAPKLKAVNPDIELVINWERNITSKTGGLETIVKTAGTNIDIIEVHWYWSWEDATFDHWTSSFPMSTKNQWYNGLSFEKEIKAFKPLMESWGHGDIKLASNEWNLAPGPSEGETPSKFESALMISEMFSQYIDADLFMANLWGIHWPSSSGNAVNRLVLDPSDNYSENPVTTVFEMFAEAMGGMKVKCSSSINGVYDIAILNQQTGDLMVYLINKKQSSQTLSTGIELEGFTIESASASSFVSGASGTGELVETSVAIEDNRLLMDLPINSITKLTVKK